MTSIVKVTDAKTGKLKRYESATGQPLAHYRNGRLLLTSLGKRKGYSTSGKRLMYKGLPAF